MNANWLVLWSLWAARVVRQPTEEVRVSGGLLRGDVSADGSHAMYLAVPYATVHSRFQAATPDPKWEGVLEAHDERVRCSQRFFGGRVIGQEDCLTLNVYTPLQRNRSLPVMVFIHGGGFRDGSGSAAMYGPDYLVKHDVILVTFNYRLEILGFLCLGIKEAPGNVGLKDQVEALKWVKRNIAAFGGDPDNVTVFGESAGAASVSYHLLSPMSQGLFHKAIIQSGSVLSPWAINFEPLETARLHAKQMGYANLNHHELYEVYRNKTTQELLSTRVPRRDGDVVLSENIFVPCIEKKIPGVEAFLTESPYELLEKGQYHKVPLIIGHNSAEGLMFIGKENDTTISNMSIYKAIPRDLVFPDDKAKRVTATKLNEIYMGNDKISKQTLSKLAAFEGDSGISYPTVATIDLILKTNDLPIYAYKFCYDGFMNFAKLFFGQRRFPGATHADELFYMFKLKLPVINTMIESKMIDRLTKMWTNFAKFGNPTPELSPDLPKIWKPVKKKIPKMLIIDKDLTSTAMWGSEAMQYWNETYASFRRKK